MPNILKLKNSFKGKIVFSKFFNYRDSLFERQLGWERFQNSEDQKLFSELQSSDNIEIKHNTYTVLNIALKRSIYKQRVKTVYICGIYSDVCIKKAAMDLFDGNINVFIIQDACNSLHGKKNHDSAIDSLEHILGKKQIISTKKVCLL